MLKDITYLGKVTNVDTIKVEVEISDDIPSSAPIIGGKQYRIGQVGTLVRIPIGNLNLYGLVSAVSNNVNKNDENVNYITSNSRHISVNLIGEKVGQREFQGGIGVFPTINDEVHIVVENDLKDIYGDGSTGLINIGKHASSENLPIYLDLHKLILRHSAILGSTGSGKSNATARIVKNILEDYEGSRIVLIDIHGEYSSAFEGKAKVFKINDKTNPLYVPFWIMNFDELSFFLVGRDKGSEKPDDKRLREEILKLKLENIDNLKAGNVNGNYVTADSPIPFDIKKMWHTFNREVYGTHNTSQKTDQCVATEMLIDEGDYKNLIPAKFEPYAMGNMSPFKSKDETMYSFENKIHSRLRDNRYDFMFNPMDYSTADSPNDIDKILRDWISNDERLTILDLSGVPFELIDISVGLVTRLIYDSMFWGRFESYTGRQRPLLMVYEEAHSYLPKSETNRHIFGYARKAVEKIFKEGRKFGIGAMVVSQRPSEISDTILAQLGTFIALRLTNSSDQGAVKSSAPNNMNSLIELLPSLRIGEAIIVGEAIKIPSRVKFDLVEPRPNSNDPDIVDCWEKKYVTKDEHYKEVVTYIREQKITKEVIKDGTN